MPFDPTYPAPNAALRASDLRDQFNAVHTEATSPETDPVFTASEAAQFVPGDKAKLDAAVQVESDPVFAASEAALLVPGDKAKLDTALQPALNINVTGNIVGSTGIFYGGSATCGVVLGAQQVDLQIDPGGNTQPVLQGFTRQLIGCPDPFNPVPTVAACWADGVLRDAAGNAFSTGAFTPANPGHWQSPAPATLAEAIDRLTAVVSNAGANPIP